MAGVHGNAVTGQVALSAATLKTVIQLVAASNHRTLVWAYHVSFEGVVTTNAPVFCELLVQTTAGTMSALTPVKRDDSIGETLQTTAQHTATAEPTAGDVLEVKEIHPQMGYEKLYPFGGELIVGGGDRIGIEVTAPAGVNCRAEMAFEE